MIFNDNSPIINTLLNLSIAPVYIIFQPDLMKVHMNNMPNKNKKLWTKMTLACIYYVMGRIRVVG